MHYGCRITHPSTGNTYEAGTARWDRVETELATISTAGASRHRAPTVMPSHRPVTSHPWNSAPFAPHAILFAFPQGNIVRSVDPYTSIQLKRSGPPAAPKPSFSRRPADAHVLTVSRPHPPRVLKRCQLAHTIVRGILSRARMARMASAPPLTWWWPTRQSSPSARGCSPSPRLLSLGS